MKRRIIKIIYNLGFAALISLATIPPMATLYLLAQDIVVVRCLDLRALLQEPSLIIR